MPTFDGTLMLCLYTKGGQAELRRDVALPFAPFPGLDLVMGPEGDPEGDTATIRSVSYLPPADWFWLNCEDQFSSVSSRNDTKVDCRCKPSDNCCTLDKWLTYFGEWEVVVRATWIARYERLPWQWPDDMEPDHA